VDQQEQANRATLPCPACGADPVISTTFAGNTAVRCDGVPPGAGPRHTIYVLDGNARLAVERWNAIAGAAVWQ
jgi:hypothetical protein